MLMMSVTFTYDDTTLTLRNPELGNSEQLAQNLIWKKNMSGTLRSYIRRPTTGPVFVLNFKMLTKAKVNELIAFIKLVRTDTFDYTESFSTGEPITRTVKLPMSNLSYNWIGRYTRVIRLTLEQVVE